MGLLSARDLHLSGYIMEVSYECKDDIHSWTIISANPNSWGVRPLSSMLPQIAQGPVKKFTLPWWLPCQWANWVLLVPAVKSSLFGFLPLISGPVIFRVSCWQFVVLGSTNMTVTFSKSTGFL